MDCDLLNSIRVVVLIGPHHHQPIHSIHYLLCFIFQLAHSTQKGIAKCLASFVLMWEDRMQFRLLPKSRLQGGLLIFEPQG